MYVTINQVSRFYYNYRFVVQLFLWRGRCWLTNILTRHTRSDRITGRRLLSPTYTIYFLLSFHPPHHQANNCKLMNNYSWLRSDKNKKLLRWNNYKLNYYKKWIKKNYMIRSTVLTLENYRLRLVDGMELKQDMRASNKKLFLTLECFHNLKS